MNSLAYLICLNTAVTVLTRDRYQAVIQMGKVNIPDLGESTKLEVIVIRSDISLQELIFF